MLRNKIRQLEDANTKTKTRLRRSEKEVVDLTITGKETEPDIRTFRSKSTQHFRSEPQFLTTRWKVDKLKE